MANITDIFGLDISVSKEGRKTQAATTKTLDDAKNTVVKALDGQIKKFKDGEFKRTWYFEGNNGWYLNLKYGVNTIEIAGGTSIGPFKKADIPAALQNAMDAVKDGKLDSEINKAWQNALKIASERKKRKS